MTNDSNNTVLSSVLTIERSVENDNTQPYLLVIGPKLCSFGRPIRCIIIVSHVNGSRILKTRRGVGAAQGYDQPVDLDKTTKCGSPIFSMCS